MLYRITPTHDINPDKIKYVTTIGRTDKYQADHVVIGMDGYTKIEIDPSYTQEEIVAAVNGGCYYRSEYLDQAGNVDICVPHREVSDSDQTWNPLRYCRKRDPAQMVKFLREREKND